MIQAYPNKLKKNKTRKQPYPNTYKNYACEISLPVYFDLTDEQVDEVIRVVKACVPDNSAL